MTPYDATDHRDVVAQVLAAVDRANATHPRARVFANEMYADWLLLERPQLKGRLWKSGASPRGR